MDDGDWWWLITSEYDNDSDNSVQWWRLVGKNVSGERGEKKNKQLKLKGHVCQV